MGICTGMQWCSAILVVVQDGDGERAEACDVEQRDDQPAKPQCARGGAIQEVVRCYQGRLVMIVG